MITAFGRRKALVLGDDPRTLLGVIRSLGRGGVEVHIGWQPPDSPVARSRYVHRAHAIPPFSADDAAWKAAMVELMRRESFDLVIPCSDPTQIPLQMHRAELERLGRIYLLKDDVFRVVSDKHRVNDLARAAGVYLPRERLVRDLADAGVIRDTFRLPVVLKPRTSYDPYTIGQRQQVHKVYHWPEFNKRLGVMLEQGPVAVQENFIGHGVGVEFLLKDGEPLLEFQHERLHEPLMGGGSSYRKGAKVAPPLRAAALAILGPLKYTGVAMVEFKVNRATGEWVFIEVNGRFWGSLPLAIASGADFPLALFEMLVHGRAAFPRQYRAGLCCRYWAGDCDWLIANLRADRNDPTLATRPLSALAVETVANVLLLRERSDTLTLDDPWPALAECRRLARGALCRLTRRVRRQILQVPAIRRRLARRARQALRDARSVLFVCKGNICRSPFAQRLAQQVLDPTVRCSSAGHYPAADRPSPDAAVAAAATLGVDLACHRSEPLTAAHIRDADVVFVFDEENFQRLSADFPCRAKLHFVGALRPDGPLWIDDPYGSDEAEFIRVYEQIRAALMTERAPVPQSVV
jgi:protein-tyrosine-phosphatase/predicted ATP-grasp superfamily ATP-dependent carboligase